MSQHAKMYASGLWRDLRGAQLRYHPLCAYCLPRAVPATVVDHIIPHQGDVALFSSPDNLQSLCKPCHDGRKQREEVRGHSDAVSAATGWPTDPKHPANTGVISNGYRHPRKR